MATTCLFMILSLAAQVADGEQYNVDENGDAVIDRCFVRVQDEVRIPAQEAGVLIKMPVKEGSRMSQGEVLATIDDREAKMGLRVAEYGLKAARQRAMDKIEVKYATKAAEFAKVDWERVLEANKNLANAIPDIEVRQKRLGWERSALQIEKAQKDRDLAILDYRTKEAEVDAAKMAVGMRVILAPFDGEVVDMYRHESEWVNPGDPILKLVRFDALYVEGYAYAKNFDREELQGRSVTVSISKARGQEISVPGTIIHVSSLIRDGEYVVRAEVQNQRVGDNWLIQPGLRARMTIHLGKSPGN
ncbi:MAG: HlyD family efflux transporter periplasmic adaptor subunit [Planctomycetes bacterium]|nr:HlyD family efflux transporter periplasmic adaptor subunit [Planctomycetota bacterium]